MTRHARTEVVDALDKGASVKGGPVAANGTNGIVHDEAPTDMLTRPVIFDGGNDVLEGDVPAPDDDTIVQARPSHAEVIPAPLFRMRRRKRVRKVTRVVRHVDTWSVFKVAVIFWGLMYVTALVSAVLLWNVAYATGTIDNVQNFLESFGWSTFEFHGGEIFHNAWMLGLFLAVAFVGLTVLAATSFNLITDLVGGIRVTVLEEEVMVPSRLRATRSHQLRGRATKRTKVRGRRARKAAAAVNEAVDVDDGDALGGDQSPPSEPIDLPTLPAWPGQLQPGDDERVTEPVAVVRGDPLEPPYGEPLPWIGADPMLLAEPEEAQQHDRIPERVPGHGG